MEAPLRLPANNDESKASDWHRLAQRTHFSHVLLVMHAVNHRARTQEQQRFEECVGNHMEYRRDICTRANCQKHEAEL